MPRADDPRRRPPRSRRARRCRPGRPPRIPRETARASAPVRPPRRPRARSPRRGAGPLSAERALELLEEALVGAVRVLAHGALELLEQAALLVVQLPRHRHVDQDPVVAAAEPLEHGHAPPSQHADLAGLGAGRKLEVFVPPERRHGYARAERRLRDRQVDRREEVVAFADEARVRQYVHLDVEVTRAAAERAGVTLTAESDPLSVVDPGRDLHLDLALFDPAPASLAGAARVHHQDTGAPAAGTRPDAPELAERVSRHLRDLSGAAAGLARLCLLPGLDAAPGAHVAGESHGNGNRSGRPVRRLDEVDLDLGGHVAASPGSPTRGRAEQVVPEEGGEDVGEVAEVEVRRLVAATAQAGVPIAVVELARLGLREHLVRLHHLAEALLGVGRLRDVGMESAGKPSERLLDLGLVRVPLDAEDLVVVALGRRHRSRVARGKAAPRPEITSRRTAARRSATAPAPQPARTGSRSRSPSAAGRGG